VNIYSTSHFVRLVASIDVETGSNTHATNCDTLQRTAPHCNILQRNSLQHTATRGWKCVTGTLCDLLGVTMLRLVATHMQHTATHCHTLPHTATHCHTLPHTATHCNTLPHTATHCRLRQRNTLQHTATYCSILQHTAAQQSASHCNTGLERGDEQLNDLWAVMMLRFVETQATHCITLQYTATHRSTTPTYICTCMYMCMCIYMYLYICIYIYMCIINILMYIYTCIYICICICIHVHLYSMHIHILPSH